LVLHTQDYVKDMVEPGLPFLALGSFIDAIMSFEDPIEKG
jgi:hypothetical protein